MIDFRARKATLLSHEVTKPSYPEISPWRANCNRKQCTTTMKHSRFPRTLTPSKPWKKKSVNLLSSGQRCFRAQKFAEADRVRVTVVSWRRRLGAMVSLAAGRTTMTREAASEGRLRRKGRRMRG